MEDPPPSYEAANDAVVVVPQRVKKYKVIVTEHPDFSKCHEKITYLATRFFSFLINEFQFEDVRFKSAFDTQQKGVSQRLNDAFFEQEKIEPRSYSVLFVESACGYSHTTKLPDINFYLKFMFCRQDIYNGTEVNHTYTYAAYIPLSQKRKR